MRLTWLMSCWPIIWYGVLLFQLAVGMEVKVFKHGVGKKTIEMVDETQFRHPTTDSFDDEVVKKPDFSDEYDELVPRLPRYEVHKYGKNIGYTLVPIVTRSKPFWSTPSPRLLKEKPWPTPDVLKGITKPSWRSNTTPVPPNSQVEQLLPADPPTGVRLGVEDLQPVGSVMSSTSLAIPKKHKLANAQPSNPHVPEPTNEEEQRPHISVVTKTPSSARLPTGGLRRITIATTTPQLPTSSAASRARPVWHHPNFWATSSQSAESTTSPTHRPVQTSIRQQVGSQTKPLSTGRVSSVLKPNEKQETQSIIQRVNSKPTEQLTGGNRIFSTATDGSRVEVIMTPQSTTLPPRQWSRHWSRHWSWSIGPDGKRTETGDRGPTSSTTGPRRVLQPLNQNQRSPAFNCRVLEAISDGLATAENDPTCKLLYPGYPLDNTCKCIFQVNGRDGNGCAKGFLYTCRKRFNGE